MADSVTNIRSVHWLSALLALIVAAVPPLVYYLSEQQRIRGILESDVRSAATDISGFIADNPRTWRFEVHRFPSLLDSILSRADRGDYGVVVRILDGQEQLVQEVHSNQPARLPTLIVRDLVYDFGEAVGGVEIEHSLRPMALETGRIALIALLSGGLVYFLMRRIPLRALQRAMDALAAEQEKLLVSEEMRRAITDAAADAIILMDNRGQVVFWNPSAERMFGYKAEETLGRDLHRLVTAETLNEAQTKGLCGFARTGTGPVLQRPLELKARRKDGTELDISLSVSAVRLREEWHAVGIVRDSTEKKRDEQVLRDAVAEAERANRVKSEFLANMSHEVRTPMNAVIGMSYLALQSDLDPEQRNYIEKIHHSAESLLGILNDILDFSKMESNKLEMEKTGFRLEDVMESLASLVSVKAEEKGVELIFDVPSEVPNDLVGDSLRLGQILINLCNNAVKFSEPQGEVVVSVGLDQEDESSVRLHFTVRDRGVGMSEEQQTRLFRAFSQADTSTTRRYGGTGLGLAISKMLTQMMGGEIWVDSKEGVGSTFHFTVYLEKSPLPIRSRFAPPVELGPLKVLVVDDNETSRLLLVEMLESFGFCVDQGARGAEAIGMLVQAERKAPYDLVLLDWKMPQLDGIATARAIQRNASITKPLRLIMVTAYGREELREAAADLDLAGILIKPVLPSSLLDVISRALGLKASEDRSNFASREDFGHATERLRGAKMLLVEDNEINQELALELLRSVGIGVELANNGAEALALLEREDFDGVLMDIQMPVMDGYIATRKIREQARFRDLPVIAMTANAMRGDRERILAAGMNDHIAKPVDVGKMFNTLANWIKPGRSAHGQAEPVPGDCPQCAPEVPELPGIDTVAGLAVTQGNAALYRKLLTKFRATEGEFEQQFRAAQASADPDAAIRVAHTLKGVAGNVGAKGVQAAAQGLEAACRGGVAADIGDALGKVVAELNRVLDGLRTVGRGWGPASTPAPAAADKAAVALLLRELRDLVASNNLRAADVVEQLDPLMTDGDRAALLRSVADAIDGYDFDAALDALAHLARAVGVEL